MKTLVVALLVSVVCFGQAVPSVKHGYGSPEGVVAGVIGDIYQRQDGGAGTTFYVKQSANSFNFGWVAYASSGSPGGSDGNIQANIAGAFGAAKQDLVDAPAFCSDAGSTDAYACTLAPAITAYVTGTHYRFKAATANTGAATINFNALGAKTVVKVAGGITTALADSDIRAGQWVDVVYDGTNMQMQSTLGNVASSVTCPAGVAGYIQFYISAGLCGGDSNLTWDNTTKTLAVGATVLPGVTGSVYPHTSVSAATGTADSDNPRLIQVGTDQFVRFVYLSSDATPHLHFVQCLDAACATSNDTEISTSGDVPALLMSTANGNLARMIYANWDENEWHYVQCTNASCSTRTDQTIASGVPSAVYGSFAISTSDDFARITWHSSNNLQFLRCTNASCSTTGGTVTIATGVAASGQTPVVNIGGDGFPITLYSAGTDELHIVHCSDADCGGTADQNISADASVFADARIGTNGKLRIVAQIADSLFAYIVCTAANCSTRTATRFAGPTSNVPGLFLSLVLDSSDKAQIAFREHGTNGTITFIQCSASANCYASGSFVVDDTLGDASYGYGSIALAADNTARMLYTTLQCCSGASVYKLVRVTSNTTLGSQAGTTLAPFGFGRFEEGTVSAITFLETHAAPPANTIWSANGLLSFYNGTTVESVGRTLFGIPVDANAPTNGQLLSYSGNSKSWVSIAGFNGLTQTITVKGSDGNDCGLVLAGGLISSTSCP